MLFRNIYLPCTTLSFYELYMHTYFYMCVSIYVMHCPINISYYSLLWLYIDSLPKYLVIINLFNYI